MPYHTINSIHWRPKDDTVITCWVTIKIAPSGYTAQRDFKITTFIDSRAAKHIRCAQNVKTGRLCTEFDKSITNFFSDMPHIVAFLRWPHWPWEFYVSQKLKHAPISLKLCLIVCLVIRIPKMYSLMYLRCLVFKLHKIIGHWSFRICTGVKI